MTTGQPPSSSAERKRDGAGPKLGILIGVVGPIVGLLMLVCTGGKLAADQSGPGIGVIIGGIAVAVLFGGWLMRGDGLSRATRVRGCGALLVLALSVGVFLASFAGLIVRWETPASYHARVGTLTTAELPHGCRVDVPAQIQRGTVIENECENATWTVDGQAHSGTVIINGDDMSADFKAPANVQAYVIDDKGYSVNRVGRMPSYGVWGAVPWLLMIPALILAIAAGFVLRRLRWGTDVTR